MYDLSVRLEICKLRPKTRSYQTTAKGTGGIEHQKKKNIIFYQSNTKSETKTEREIDQMINRYESIRLYCMQIELTVY